MDTLIFNRFVGAACIFEYHDEKIEIIRANDRYAKTIGGESCTTEFILNMRWEDHMDAEAAMVTKAAVYKAIETGDDVTFEAAYINLPGAKGKTYLRATFRLIAKTSDRYLLYGTDENITAQREAEEKEKKTEKKRLEAAQQLQAIMNSMNGGVYAVTADTDGNVNIVFTNEQYYSMFGYTKEQFEFEGADIFSVVHPDEREKIRGKINRLLKSGEYAVMEYSCKKQDGNIVYVRCDAAITKIDGIGERVLISIITDMTETVRTERALKQASIRLKAIMENINGGITATIIRDGHPMLLFANDQYFIQLGLESREQYTQDYELKMAMMHPEDRDWVVAQANKLSETNTSGTIIYRIVRPDGGIRWIQSNISLSNLPDVAEPVQLAVTNDITELREAEQKEREMSDRYRAIMENIGSAVSVISIEGERIRHILANNRYYDIFGYTEEQYREEFGDRVGPISPADRKRVMRELDKAVNSDELVLLDYRAIRRDKKEIWIRHRLISTEIEGIEGRVQRQPDERRHIQI
ncbi:MAG: PAS domain-containing protein, partial [Ruminococcaceae bacterium]|nr:PAS domain-containing protein [Oscillospiraceae bacterium]